MILYIIKISSHCLVQSVVAKKKKRPNNNGMYVLFVVVAKAIIIKENNSPVISFPNSVHALASKWNSSTTVENEDAHTHKKG